VVLALLVAATSTAGNFHTDVTINFGGQRANISDDGLILSLTLDNYSGSGFVSNDRYLYGRFDVGMKLTAGDSAGTDTSFYLSSQGPNHDEIDFEFLGNLSGQPYALQTNVYIDGTGNREQQIYLWFDPTQDFHTYTILWNSYNILYLVDGTPIRVFRNYTSERVDYPSTRPMNVYASLWDASDWATEGGKIKANYSDAPFTAYYRNYTSDGCAFEEGTNSSSCIANQTWDSLVLNSTGRSWIDWTRENYMVYNYCDDTDRFPQGLPLECSLP
ncbi:hypothetical protein M569_01943, partial [Genlisea aurea]